MFLKHLHLSFGAKIFIYLLGVMIFIAATFNIFYLQSQQESFNKETIKDGRMLITFLTSNTRSGIHAKDEKQISDSLKTAITIKGVVGACAYSHNGILLHRETRTGWNETEICIKEKLPSVDFFGKLSTSANVLHIENDETLEFWNSVWTKSETSSQESSDFSRHALASPPRDSTSPIGFVGLIFDKSVLSQAFTETLAKHILLLFSLIAGAYISSYFIIRTVTRPLSKLVSRLKDHLKVHDMKVDAKGDLDILANTFGDMIDTLSNSYETIHELKTGLEAKVLELEKEINVRRKTEKALLESENKFRSISDSIADGIAIIQDGKIKWINNSFGEILGYSFLELIGKGPEILFKPPAGDRAGESRIREWALISPSDSRYQTEAYRKDGTIITLDIKASGLFFGGTPATELIVRDITEIVMGEREKNELEIKALSQSKLAAIGEIATGVAHEMNQPLTFIKIVYQSTLLDLENNRLDLKATSEKFKEALHQVERITAVTEHLRSFGRKDMSVFSPIVLADAFNNSMILMGEKLRLLNMDVIREFEEGLPQVNGNKIQLEQVFINLLQNSIQALEKDNTGTIRVRIEKKGDFLKTTFSDTGPGIQEPARDKIFEPFYTTKTAEAGTGLGLAIVSNIIKEHKGSILYREMPDWGASFIISLPVI